MYINEEENARDEDARFWFTEGECDAIAMVSPQHPENIYYMMGFRDAKHRLLTGEICWRWNAEHEFQPVDLEDYLF